MHLATFVECPACGDSGLEEYVNGVTQAGTRTVAIIRCANCGDHYEIDAVLRLMGTEHAKRNQLVYRPSTKEYV